MKTRTPLTMTSLAIAATGIAFAVLILGLAINDAVAQADDGQSAGLTEPVEFEGIVRAARAADISPRFDGLVESINFKPGELVKKGQLLVQIMTLEQDYLLKIDEANTARAAAQLDLAKAELERAEKLRDRDVVSEAQLLEATARRDIAAADFAKAQTQVDMRKIIIREFSLHAPFDGIISEPFVNEGAYITKDAREVSRIATVTQLDPIHVVTEVPYEIYARRHALLGTEQAMTERLVAFLVLPDGTEYPYHGRIVSGAYAFDEEAQQISSIAEFPNPDRLLRPGLRVTVRSMVRPAAQ